MVVVLLAGAVLATAACGVDDPGAEPPPTSPTTHFVPTTTAPSTTLSQQQQDEADLRQLAADWYETRNSILKDGAEVEAAEAYLTGSYLATFGEDVEERRASGNSSEAGAASREVVTAIEIDGDTATVETCLVDADLLRNASGEVINDETGTFRYRTKATLTSDGWRFERRERTGSEGGDTCDA